jgi:hypothetical protein
VDEIRLGRSAHRFTADRPLRGCRHFLNRIRHREGFELHSPTDIVSETDLADAARRLDLATGTVLGTVAPIPVTLPTENSANLLHFNSGPVAQKDRAAVS